MQRLSKLTMLVLCTVLALPGMAQEVHRFSVRECIEYARQNNLQVKNALLDIQIQEQSNRGTTSAALPSLSASGSFTDYFKVPIMVVPGEFFGRPGEKLPVSFQTKYNTTGSINLRQVLFDGQVFVGLQARATSIEFRKKNYEVTEEAIATNIYKVYYQLAASKTQISLLDANIERATKLHHDASVMHQNGFAEQLDVDRAAVQLANLETEKQKLLNTIANGNVGLKFLIGMPVKDSLVVTATVTEDEIKNGMLDSSYAYTDRLDYQSTQLTQKLNEYNVKRYKLSYWPSVNLNGSYSKNWFSDKFDMFGKSDWYTTLYLGLGVSFSIFDGFAKDASIKQAKLELQQTTNRLDDLKNSIDNEVTQALNTYRSAVITLDLQKKNRTLAESVYNQTKKKYESGLASNTDLTNTQTELRNAETSYISAMYDAIVAKIDYLKAIGKLPR
ncbi:MAG: TolC family protein [Chitinophagaceae bacterium]